MTEALCDWNGSQDVSFVVPDLGLRLTVGSHNA